jgi:hypothetical protein
LIEQLVGVEHKLAADYGAFEAIWKSITATQVADFMNKSGSSADLRSHPRRWPGSPQLSGDSKSISPGDWLFCPPEFRPHIWACPVFFLGRLFSITP